MHIFRFALLTFLTLALSGQKIESMEASVQKSGGQSALRPYLHGLNDYKTFIAAQKMFERFDDHRKTRQGAEDLTPLKIINEEYQVAQGLQLSKTRYAGLFKAIHTPWGSRFTQGSKLWSAHDIASMLKITLEDDGWTMPLDNDDEINLLSIIKIDTTQISPALFMGARPSPAVVTAIYTKHLARYQQEQQKKEDVELKEDTEKK